MSDLVFGPSNQTCLRHWQRFPCPICHSQMMLATAQFKTILERKMATRLKVICSEKRTRAHWDKSKGQLGGVILAPVSGGSDENKSFFEATPSGRIEFDTINAAALAEFEPGVEYYVTIEKA